jgi:hypothetical protein
MILSQPLFQFRLRSSSANGDLMGEFEASPIRPHMMERASYYGLEDEVAACFPLPRTGGG